MMGSVNAVDSLFGSFPIYLYLNPALAGHLLTPLLEYQEDASYSNPYAALNLGNTVVISSQLYLLSGLPSYQDRRFRTQRATMPRITSELSVSTALDFHGIRRFLRLFRVG